MIVKLINTPISKLKSAVKNNGIIETVKDETKNKNVDHLELS